MFMQQVFFLWSLEDWYFFCSSTLCHVYGRLKQRSIRVSLQRFSYVSSLASCIEYLVNLVFFVLAICHGERMEIWAVDILPFKGFCEDNLHYFFTKSVVQFRIAFACQKQSSWEIRNIFCKTVYAMTSENNWVKNAGLSSVLFISNAVSLYCSVDLKTDAE